MYPSFFIIGNLLSLSFLTTGLIVCIILLIIKIVKKRSKKAVIISTGINIFLIAADFLFVSSHKTYYKYNDWAIVDSSIYSVKQKYGEFDIGEIRENKKGKVAYYIYTDNGPILPDHLDHYYYIEYDECGVVYNVYDGCQPGG